MNNAKDQRPWSERVLDQALPDDLDWQDKVRAYPLASMVVALGLGFVLGRSRGKVLLHAVTGFAAERVTDTIQTALDSSES